MCNHLHVLFIGVDRITGEGGKYDLTRGCSFEQLAECIGFGKLGKRQLVQWQLVQRQLVQRQLVQRQVVLWQLVS
jgi:hypothetical protein